MVWFRRIQGKSMHPLLRDGQLVLLLRCRRVPSIGSIALIDDDGVEKIKVITRLEGQRAWYSGANNQSTDSQDRGWVTCSSVGARLAWPRVSARRALMQATSPKSL